MTNEATKLLGDWLKTGCPHCGGDCSAANPPIFYCLPERTRAYLSQAPAAEAPTTFDCGCRWLENGEPAAICERHLRREQWIAERGAPSAAPAPTPDMRNMIEQFCKDLNGAHDEILKLQGVKPHDFGNYDWPEWTPQANSIRWAEKLLGKRLAKTTAWSLFP